MKTLRTGRLYACLLFFRFLPETRFFELKAALLSWAGAAVGNNVRICSSVNILGVGSLEIGEDTWIGHQTLIICNSRVSIGKKVDVAPKVFIGTGTHVLDPVGDHSAGQGINKDVVVEDGVWLGVGCLILPGVSIGQKAVVGAGAVVTRNVSSRAIVAGIPAKVIKCLNMDS